MAGFWDWLAGGGEAEKRRREADRSRRSRIEEQRARDQANEAYRRSVASHGRAQEARRRQTRAEREARAAGFRRLAIGRQPGGHVHIDAKFDTEEMAEFLLGDPVFCRSTWINIAQWEEERTTLTLTLIKNGRDYRFPGIDYAAALVFGNAESKGLWYHRVWRGAIGGYALEPALEPGMGHRIGG